MNMLWQQIEKVSERPILEGKFRNQNSDKVMLRFFQKFCLKQIVNFIQQQQKLFHFKYQFEIKFEMLRQKDKSPNSKLAKIIGIKFDLLNQSQQFYSDSDQLLKKTRSFLKQKLNQRGFHQQLKPLKKLGKGSFASVYLVKSLQTNQLMAAKSILKYTFMASQNGLSALINEIEIMRQLNHKNLMKLYEVFQSDHTIYMCVEPFDGGQLIDRIRAKGKLQIYECQQIIKYLLEGIFHMHSKNIMHRDLKPQNILFRNKDDQECIIVDFGLATHIDQKEYIYHKCGTPGYVAPEILNLVDQKQQYGKQCDIYSLGLIFYLMLTGKSAFTGVNFNQIIKENKHGKINFNINQIKQNMSSKNFEFAVKLLKNMLQLQPKKRISASMALKHEFINSPISRIDKNRKCSYKQQFDQIIKNQLNNLTLNTKYKHQITGNTLQIPNKKQMIMNSPLLISSNKERIQKERAHYREEAKQINFIMKTPLFSGKMKCEQQKIDTINPSPMMAGLLGKMDYNERRKKSKFWNPQEDQVIQLLDKKKITQKLKDIA